MSARPLKTFDEPVANRLMGGGAILGDAAPSRPLPARRSHRMSAFMSAIRGKSGTVTSGTNPSLLTEPDMRKPFRRGNTGFLIERALDEARS